MSSLRTLVLLAVALFACGSLASKVEAQADNTADARAVFDEAARQFEAHNYALALRGFTQSYGMLVAVHYERAGYTLYNIGRCNEELGQLGAAADAYRRFLSEADEQAPYRAEVRDRIADIQARIELSGDPGAGAGGGGGNLSWVGWVIAGLGGAAAIAGVVTGVVALDEGDQLAARCPGFVCTDPADQALINEADTLAIATDVLLVAGLTVAAAGVVLALVLDLTAESPTPTAGCSSDGCQVGLTQRF